MKNHTQICLPTLLAAIFISVSCAQADRHMSMENDVIRAEHAMPAADAEVPTPDANSYAPEDFVSSSAARENAADTSRRFIRRAELIFQTKDVVRSTYAIEDIIARNGGFVEHTELMDDTEQTTSTRVSRDSILETSVHSLINNMTLRIPVRQLDATLKEIAAYASFMHTRKVSATDVRISLLRNNLARRRAARLEKRLGNAVHKSDDNLIPQVIAEDRIAIQQEAADQALLSNLELKDQIAYSAISVQMWQLNIVRHVMKANEKQIAAYRPPFGIRLFDALRAGWNGFIAFVIFLMNFWPLWFICIAAWCIYRGIKKYRRGKN